MTIPDQVILGPTGDPLYTDTGPGAATTVTGRTVAGQTVMPHVDYTPIRIAGVHNIDRGDESEWEVLHQRVGERFQGDRLARADFPEATDFDWLVRQGAVRPIARVVPEGPEEAPARGRGRPKGS
jgi:hypothetical protein